MVAEIKSSDVSSSAEHLVAARPDVLFICADRGSPDPAKLLEGLATRGLRRPTVALACQFSDYVVWRLCKLQIRGAIEDAAATRQNIAAALSAVNSGLGWFSPDFRSRVHRLRNDPAAFPRLLSNRQVAVLRCIAHGLRNDEVGDHLSCSWSTAKRHRADLLRKLGAPDSISLTREAQRLGFADFGLPGRGMGTREE